MNRDATVIVVGLVGVLLVGAFSFTSGRDRDGSLAIRRWLDLDGLGWERGDAIASWAVRFGWSLILLAGVAQCYVALE